MTTEVHSDNGFGCGSGSSNYLLIKGASEIILDCCNKIHYWDQGDSEADGAVKPLTPEVKTEIIHAIEGMARETLRTLCLAYKVHDANSNGMEESDEFGVYPVEKKGFTLLCVTGIRDILRPTVKASVAKCQVAGIKVRMVTGDNLITAEAIAKDCGIISQADAHDPNYVPAEHVKLGKDFWEHIGGVVKEKKTKKKGDKVEVVTDDDGNPVMHDVI